MYEPPQSGVSVNFTVTEGSKGSDGDGARQAEMVVELYKDKHGDSQRFSSGQLPLLGSDEDTVSLRSFPGGCPQTPGNRPTHAHVVPSSTKQSQRPRVSLAKALRVLVQGRVGC